MLQRLADCISGTKQWMNLEVIQRQERLSETCLV